jgi:hypothetical protein
MPKQTAQMLIEAIRDFSLADEGTAGSQRLHSACNALAPP